MLRPVPNPEALIESVLAVADVQDRAADARRVRGWNGFHAMSPERHAEVSRSRLVPAKRYAFSAHEFAVYGILRAKHGMSQADAAEAVLRSRNSEPETSER